ncbi:MAG: AEC family transporter [Eubacteriales bacterium]|nr:AEC family transporter [Eubacteriales bacterium]
MLTNFIIAVRAVVPIFLLILAGMGAGRLSILTEQELSHVNKAIFQVMFPVMMFYNVYSADFSGVIMPGYIAFCLIMLLVVYGVGLLTAFLTEKRSDSRGALVQAVYRGNFVLMGIPIMRNLMGEEAMGLTAVMVAIVVPCYNVLAVITLEAFRGGKLKPTKLAGRILTNPLIFGAAAGILAAALGVRLPETIESPVSQIASAASVTALMVMGASFRFGSIRENRKNLVIGVAGKLIVSPGLALGAGYALGLRGLPLALLIIMFGAPCAVSGYTMAQQMDSNADLAAGCLIFTSLFSCATICGWIFLFKQLGAF